MLNWVTPTRAEGFELFAMLGDGADEAEAVDHFVRDEVGVVAADFAVVEVVVFAAILDERGKAGGEFFGLVLADEIEDVI